MQCGATRRRPRSATGPQARGGERNPLRGRQRHAVPLAAHGCVRRRGSARPQITPARLSGSAARREQAAVCRRAPHFPQALDRARQRGLLARHARDESSAANLSPRFQAGGRRAPGPPRRGDALPREHAAEHHAVTPEQRHAWVSIADSPPSGSVAAGIAVQRPAKFARRSSVARLPCAVQIRARIPENPSDAARPAATSEPIALRADPSSRSQAPRRSLKNEAPRARNTSSRRRALAVSRSAGSASPGSVRSACHASACSRRNSASASRAPARRIRGFRVRVRQARPGDLSRETEQVEHRRVVSVDARGEDRALPGGGRHLESVEHLDRFAKAVTSGQLRRFVHVLPLEQEAHEVRGGDRLDLGPEAVHGVAMDAREQAPVAPLQGRLEAGGWRLEAGGKVPAQR